jgi:hypothetical protein
MQSGNKFEDDNQRVMAGQLPHTRFLSTGDGRKIKK